MNLDNHPRAAFAIGLVLFHPEETLARRVDLMTELGLKVYVFDNSPEDDRNTKSFKHCDRVSYMTAGKNLGIGYALATLCATAYAQGFDRLLFLDQDTGISAATLDFVRATIEQQPSPLTDEYALLAFSGKPGPEKVPVEARLAISSGSLFHLPTLSKLGWHNHRYFVDCVDYELCVRARRSGYRIGIVHNTPDFDHVSEQPDRSISFLGKQLLVRKYSPSRIKDALSAYMKLILGGMWINKPADTYTLARSLTLYVFGQLMARITPNHSEARKPERLK